MPSLEFQQYFGISVLQYFTLTPHDIGIHLAHALGSVIVPPRIVRFFSSPWTCVHTRSSTSRAISHLRTSRWIYATCSAKARERKISRRCFALSKLLCMFRLNKRVRWVIDRLLNCQFFESILERPRALKFLSLPLFTRPLRDSQGFAVFCKIQVFFSSLEIFPSSRKSFSTTLLRHLNFLLAPWIHWKQWAYCERWVGIQVYVKNVTSNLFHLRIPKTFDLVI